MHACKAKTFPAAHSSSKCSALTAKNKFCFHLCLFSMCQHSLLFSYCKTLFCRNGQLYQTLRMCVRMYVYTHMHYKHQFFNFCLFIANSPSLSSIYLCLGLQYPYQLLLMEISLHYFSIIKEVTKPT